MLGIFSSTAIRRSTCSLTPAVGILRFDEGEGTRHFQPSTVIDARLGDPEPSSPRIAEATTVPRATYRSCSKPKVLASPSACAADGSNTAASV
jgi:hypothetical protein